MCACICVCTYFLAAAFFFFLLNPFHTEIAMKKRVDGQVFNLGTPERKEVNAERKNVMENAQGEVKYLGKQMIESVTGTTRSLLEINMNEMLCFIDCLPNFFKHQYCFYVALA